MPGVHERGVDPRRHLVLDPVVDPAETLQRPARVRFVIERLVEVHVELRWLGDQGGFGVRGPARGRDRIVGSTALLGDVQH